jgi:phosphate transport system substrate-binding protein
MNMKKLFNNEAGVSPIVATLVLVVVAIAGAAAVGTILGSFSGDVSDNANSANAMGSASTEILVAGSSTVQPVSELIAKEFMANNPGIKVTVQSGGSDAGIASAGMGIVDIGAASKFMDDAAKKKFPNLQEHVIGGSAVVVIVNKADSPLAANVTSLTRADLKSLYNAIQNDATTNVTSGTIVYQRTEGSGTEETFAKFVELGSDVDGAKDDTDAVKTLQKNAIGNEGVLDAVISTPKSIGFVDYGFAAKNKDKVAIVSILENGVVYTADDVTIKAAVKEQLNGATSSTNWPLGSKGLCRPLVYLTDGQPSSLVNTYLQFAMSPASLESFHGSGYYGITELQ